VSRCKNCTTGHASGSERAPAHKLAGVRHHSAIPSLPNPYRCLRGVGISVAALLLLACLGGAEAALCSLLGDSSMLCEAMSAPYEWWFVAAAVGGVAHTAYAFYRDFFGGRYYSDLAKIQQLQ
jgi:hypothetical protein